MKIEERNVFIGSPNSNWRNRAYSVSISCGVLGFVIGLTVMFSWWVHFPPLIQLIPGLAPMQFNTALGIAMGSGALFLLATNLPARPATLTLGLATILIGLGSLLEYALNINFGLDQLFTNYYLDYQVRFPGRMSPLTAGCLSLLGITVVLASCGRKRFHVVGSGLLACVFGIIAWLAILGYLLGINSASDWGSYTQMAVNTALSFALVSAGFVAWSWRMAKEKGFVLLRWVPLTISITLIIMIGLISSLSLARLEGANSSQRRTLDVIDVAQMILGEIGDGQRGMRGYILFGNPESLDLYRGAVKNMPSNLRLLEDLTSRSPDQLAQIKKIHDSLDKLVAYSNGILDALSKGGIQAVLAMDGTGEGLRLVDRARQDLTDFTNLESDLLEKRSRVAAENYNDTKKLVLLGCSLTALLLILANGLAGRELKSRMRVEKKLIEFSSTQKAILNSASKAIVSTDMEGVVTSFNETAEHWLGYKSSDVVGKCTPALWHDGEEVVRHAKVLSNELGRTVNPGFEVFTAKLSTDFSTDSEWTLIRKDGTRFPATLSATKLTDERGNVTGFMGIITDNTVRKAMEQELEKNRLLLDGILKNSLDGVIAYDSVRDEKGQLKDFRFILVNPAAERYSTISAAHLVGKSLLESFPSIKQDGLFDKYVEIVETGKSKEFEYLVMRSGSPRWYRVAGAKLGDGLSVSYAEITQRKKSEEALRISEERFRLIVDGVKDYALLMLDPEGYVVSWNRGAERLKGYKAEEILGKHFSCFYPPEKLAAGQFKMGLETAAMTGRFEEEGQRVRKDGSQFLANVVITALYDDSKKLVGFAKVTRDITQQKLFESKIVELNNDLERRVELRTQELSESEKGFRLLAETLPQLIWTAKPDGGVDYYNQRWFDYTGTTLDEAREWGWKMVLHPEDIESCLDQWTRSLQFGLPYEVEYRFKRASDGAYRWHLGRAFPLKDERGKILKWVGTCTDIDDIKRAEDGVRKANEELERRVEQRTSELESLNESLQEDLRQRKELERKLTYQAKILDLANDTIFVRDLTDHITYWNKGAERVYGWTKEESFGQISHTLLKTQFGEPYGKITDQLWKTGHWEGELVHVLKNGQTITVASRWSVHRDENGTPDSIIEMNFDITERKRMERELNSRNAELVTAAQAKNSFLANMSHELRTPLNGIIGFSEILADGLPGEINELQKEYLTDIMNSGQHLLQLINDILDLAKVEAGKMEVHPELFLLPKTVEQVCAVVSPMVHKKGLTLHTSIAPTIGWVNLDEQKLKQILYNLLSNAVKFTDKNGRIELNLTENGSDSLYIAVTDTGIGIKPENMNRLFREFDQLDSSLTRKYEGTGLGLALTRKLVELHGGRIVAESEFGKGTTFRVTLPLRIPELAA